MKKISRNLTLLLLFSISSQYLCAQFTSDENHYIKALIKSKNGLQFRLDSVYDRGEVPYFVGPSRYYQSQHFVYDSLNRHVETFSKVYNGIIFNSFYHFIYDTNQRMIYEHRGIVNQGNRDTTAYYYYEYDSINRAIAYYMNSPSRISLTTFQYLPNKVISFENLLVNGTWSPLFSTEKNFNSAGQLLLLENFSLQSGNWQKTNYNDYYYTNQRLDSIATFTVSPNNVSSPYSRTKFYYNTIGNIVSDTTFNFHFGWSAMASNHYYLNLSYADSSLMTDFYFGHDNKIDSLKSWRFHLGSWLPVDSNIYYYSPISSTVGLAEHEQVKIIVFPNPASNYLKIESDQDVSFSEILMYDSQAHHLKTMKNESLPLYIDISDLKQGMYFLVFKNQSNNYSVHKFQKQ